MHRHTYVKNPNSHKLQIRDNIKHEFTKMFNIMQWVYSPIFLSCYVITRSFKIVALCTNDCQLLTTEDLHVN